jgi:hypothetical protein
MHETLPKNNAKIFFEHLFKDKSIYFNYQKTSLVLFKLAKRKSFELY